MAPRLVGSPGAALAPDEAATLLEEVDAGMGQRSGLPSGRAAMERTSRSSSKVCGPRTTDESLAEPVMPNESDFHAPEFERLNWAYLTHSVVLGSSRLKSNAARPASRYSMVRQASWRPLSARVIRGSTLSAFIPIAQESSTRSIPVHPLGALIDKGIWVLAVMIEMGGAD